LGAFLHGKTSGNGGVLSRARVARQLSICNAPLLFDILRNTMHVVFGITRICFSFVETTYRNESDVGVGWRDFVANADIP
jgi:hypothetical protein